MIFHDAQPPWHAGGTQQPPTGETSYPHRAIPCVALPKRRQHGARRSDIRQLYLTGKGADNMKDIIEVNGEKYQKVSTAGEKLRIVIVENRGLTFVGRVDISGDSDQLLIRDARCVIRWGTENHLAELAECGPREHTRLGARRDVTVFRRNIVAAYECSEAWT